MQGHIWSVESSAKRWRSFSTWDVKSSMYIRKSRGPSTLACGTPADRVLDVKVMPSKTTAWWLLVKNDVIHPCMSPWMPYDVNLVKRTRCQTRSKAFFMSRAITLTSCWESKESFHHWVIYESMSTVDLFSRNPYCASLRSWCLSRCFRIYLNITY